MLDWSFNEYECLPLLVSLLLDKEVSRNEDALDVLYNADKKEMSASLWDAKNNDFLNLILDAVDQKILITPAVYAKAELSKDNFDEIFVEPVNFFRWVESQGYSLTYSVKSNVEHRERDTRIKCYKNHTISKEEVCSLMREPLWPVSYAIMYLHGFRPVKQYASGYYVKDSNSGIVSSDDEMSLTNRYLYDSAKLNEIKIYRDAPDKVKPREFMNWASGFDMGFSNQITAEPIKDMSSMKSKEKETLLKILLGLALTNYEFNPQASRNSTAREIKDDLLLHGISVDEDTVRKWLNESKEHLPDDWNKNS